MVDRRYDGEGEAAGAFVAGCGLRRTSERGLRGRTTGFRERTLKPTLRFAEKKTHAEAYATYAKIVGEVEEGGQDKYYRYNFLARRGI